MSDRKRKGAQIILFPAQMKQIARYELTFDKITADFTEDACDLVIRKVYSYTLDDLKQALINLKAAAPTVGEFWENWFYPLTQLESEFDLDRARGSLADQDDTPEYLREFTDGLSLSDSSHFCDIWWNLDNAVEFCEASSALPDVVDIDELLNGLSRYEQNKGKPIEEWNFTKEEMGGYISLFDSDNYVKNATDNQLALCRRFLDVLCDQTNELALYIKGYACYGGNRLYPCDWNTSRDYITRLFDRKDDPQYANTLGYIYYYGRCNGGVPEYDKAFYYFGIAAANGLYEGMYKLADMFWHGYGCKESARTARSLYGMVYEDSFKNFQKGHEANFADAALRMGNVFANGIGEKESPEKAYYYYLQADYAARLRAETSDFFGHTTVVNNVRNALDEVKAKLPEDYFCDHMDYDVPYQFVELTEYGNRCKLTRSYHSDGSVILTAARMATRGNPEPEPMLFTFPRLQYCVQSADFSLTLLGLSELWFLSDALYVKYDFCAMNWDAEQYEFYWDDELVAYVKCECYRLSLPEGKLPSKIF
jgi:hypothetical protein